jgi:acyl dehydratase
MTRSDTPFGPVSGPDMAEWCALLNDDNEIHLAREAAEAAGFGPNRVNPGPANLAYLMSALMRADPDTGFAAVDARFTGNVLEDDHLVAGIDEKDATLLRDGTPVVTATFTFGEPE